MNLTKTTCRDYRCNTTAAWLVGDGVTSALLCPAHARMAVHSLRGLGARIVAPAAQTTPSAYMTASLAADRA